MPTLTDRTFATGKRKTAVARVILRPGTGNILVNNRPYDQYFPRPASQLLILQPFEIVEVVGRYDVVANVAGGGLAAQADAVRFGIARALTGGDGGRAPHAPQARGPADPRRPQEGAQEVRPARRPQALPVLQALILRPPPPRAPLPLAPTGTVMVVPERLRVAIVGATGYTGAELLRLLLSHPRVQVTALAAREKLTPRASAMLPALTGLCELPIEPFDPDLLASRADVAFCALPHGASIPAVRALRERGLLVLDLSADFRLRDPATYAQWYGQAHGAPELLPEAVYGLVELHREALRGAKLVAVPGCYPTASTLPLIPLLREGLLRPEGIIVHAMSGVSGAGRSPARARTSPRPPRACATTRSPARTATRPRWSRPWARSPGAR